MSGLASATPAIPATQPQTSVAAASSIAKTEPSTNQPPVAIANTPPVSSPPATPEQSSSPTVGSSKPASAADSAAGGVAAAGTQDIEKSWKQALSALDAEGDLTADMASGYERLEWKSPECLVVTMSNAYNSEQCAKQERRERLESALATAAGRSIRLDFVASQTAMKQAVPEPRMTRTQQIRELQQNSYVRQTMDLFDAEVTDFYKR